MNNKIANTIGVLWVIFCTVWGGVSLYATEFDEPPVQPSQLPQLKEIRQSALSGSAMYQFILGEMFEYGRQVNQSDSLATQWYNKSSAQGYSQAQYRLAVLMDNGWGNPVDKKRAFELYRSAAHGGHQLARHDLAIMYFKGTGTDRNLVQAYKWLKIASLSGNPLMQKHMVMVAAAMSRNEIERAVMLATEWLEQPGI